MPRNVRNFWVDAEIDGRETRLTGGPVARDGGISIHVQMRDGREITLPLKVNGFARPDGSLRLIVEVVGHETVVVETKR